MEKIEKCYVYDCEEDCVYYGVYKKSEKLVLARYCKEHGQKVKFKDYIQKVKIE